MKHLTPKQRAYFFLLAIALLIILPIVSKAQQTFPIGNKTARNESLGEYYADSALRAPRVKKIYPYWDSVGNLAVTGNTFWFFGTSGWNSIAPFDTTHIYHALADSMQTARDSIATLRALISAGGVQYGDSTVVFVTPTQMNDSLAGYLKKKDSSLYVTHTQMLDSIENIYTWGDNSFFSKVDSNTLENPITLSYFNTHEHAGTVTSVATSTGLIGGTITSTGTLQIDSSVVPKWDDTLAGNRWLVTPKYLSGFNYGAGTVTSVATSTGIIGGTITSTGTIQIDSSVIPKWDDTLAGNRWLVTPKYLSGFSYGTGTVTSITAGHGLNGGTITASGTISPDTTILIKGVVIKNSGILHTAISVGVNNGVGIDTITQSLLTQAPHTALMGATSGTVTPTFRNIDSADVPDLTTKEYRQKLADSLLAYIVASYYAKPAIRTTTVTTYTLQSSDNGQGIGFNSGSAITVTIPPSLPTNFSCLIQQQGAGTISFADGAGVTHIIAGGGTHTVAAGSQVQLNQKGGFTDSYYIGGHTQ